MFISLLLLLFSYFVSRPVRYLKLDMCRSSNSLISCFEILRVGTYENNHTVYQKEHIFLLLFMRLRVNSSVSMYPFSLLFMSVLRRYLISVKTKQKHRPILRHAYISSFKNTEIVDHKPSFVSVVWYHLYIISVLKNWSGTLSWKLRCCTKLSIRNYWLFRVDHI